jgi:hypothetical protein
VADEAKGWRSILLDWMLKEWQAGSRAEEMPLVVSLLKERGC